MVLAGANHILVEEITSLLRVASQEADLTRAIKQLNQILPFRFWSLVITPLTDEFPSLDTKFINNYPPDYVAKYLEHQFYNFDLVSLNNFNPENFGPLTHWGSLYQEVEQGPSPFTPEQLEGNRALLDFIKDLGILRDGYSIGWRSTHRERSFGSIFSIADQIEVGPMSELVLKNLIQPLHMAMIQVYYQD